MVKPESALRRLMRDTGKLLQPYGFEGAEPTWVRVMPGGVATVARTRTFRSFTGGQQVLRFGLGAWATPTVWWEFRNWRNERLGLPPVAIETAAGPGLLPDEGLPEDPDRLWSVRLDPDQPGHLLPGDIDVVREELPRRVHAHARRALRLLEPDSYLEELLAQPNPTAGVREVIAVLLADHGPSARLDDALDHLLCAAREQSAPYPQDVVDFIAARTLSSRSA
ncbi:hypothetical protein [Nocardia aurantiaca]|uniref:DUF4304 domain-containing protein n=1 Tax=Nocardia aurantiaca TaxID=2675850 RepID=A0A6I3KYQ2_9NOCA|nr:hypothetical protein [Nocardia aurantiaca]MTE12689.1 hypothetical protein [Nocardia aurantiaca]